MSLTNKTRAVRKLDSCQGLCRIKQEDVWANALDAAERRGIERCKEAIQNKLMSGSGKIGALAILLDLLDKKGAEPESPASEAQDDGACPE